MKTVIMRLTSPATSEVENVIRLAPGTPYDPPAGRVMLNVPSDAYVGPGFIGTLTDGVWSFAPPEEPPVEDDGTVQEKIAAAEAKLNDAMAALNAVKAALG